MITFSFPGIFIPVKSENYNQLINAYGKYRDATDDLVLKFDVESAYWHCYKKRASAELIDKLAKLEWGPFRAWDVFGKSSSALLQYDYVTGQVKEGWGYRYPKSWIAFSTIGQPVLYFCSVFLMFFGCVLAWGLLSTWGQLEVKNLVSFPGEAALLFIFFAFSPGTFVAGASGLYVWFLSSRASAFDAQVYKLKQLLDEQQQAN
ncbi:hypothetical protein [Vreelandella hamiltonii]|uniref:Uncharacterized protein n=1 Tax=Halomonas johnsoniae TaxID=502832 RepID=A0ABQ2WAM2_9GAMM|nr:hypothetical protein [Halomonas johnsoniae]GGW44892.1 hypothetical protein GCM10007158_01860 [Halomonas johnsoniae]